MSRFDLGVCAVIALLVALIFSQTTQHDFVRYDDPVYIHDNPIVQKGLTSEGFVWAFVHGADANYWTPITWLSHMLDVQLFGLDAGKHHRTSVVVHALAAMMLYTALLALTGSAWPSAAVAVLWAVHPLHVESVAWIAERKDTLSALFAFATIWAYARYAKTPSPARYAGVLGLFLAALMCKPMVVTLPAALLLLDYWPLKRPVRWGHLILEKVPMFALTILIAIVTVIAQKHAGAVRSVEQFPLSFRLTNAVVSIGRYLLKTVWPTDMTVFYPPPGRWSVVAILASAFVVIAITVIAIAQIRKRPYLIIGWLWFLGMLLPVIGIVQVGRQAMGDRYTYLPHVGLFIAIAWSLVEIPSRKPVTALVVACVLALSIVSHNQVEHWKNTQTLFEHALVVTTDNDVAHQQLANVFMRQRNFPEAEKHYRAAVRLDPDYALARTNLANLLVRTRRFDEAIEHYEAALQGMRPDRPKIYLGLAIALSGAKQYLRADETFAEALRLDPNNPAIRSAWEQSRKERAAMQPSTTSAPAR